MVAVTDELPRKRLLKIGPDNTIRTSGSTSALWSETHARGDQTLAEFDPSHASVLSPPANAIARSWPALDRECREQLAEIPASRRVLVTAHDAFHYFGRAYDVEVRAIQGVSTESEAGVREINELVEFIDAARHQGGVRRIERQQPQCRSPGRRLRCARPPAGGRRRACSDAMGRLGTPEGTYVGMVRHNVDTIVKALK